jgi:hypothetical protein
MNSAASQSHGSTRESYSALDVTSGSHWACGMPLSYVEEMASHCLRLCDESTKDTPTGIPGSAESSAP